MKLHSASAFCCLLVATFAPGFRSEAKTPPPISGDNPYGKLPLSFEANEGQTDLSVQFLSRGGSYTLFLRPTEAILTLSRHAPTAKGPLAAESPAAQPAQPSSLQIRLQGANAGANATREDPQITRTNYFLGSDPSRWRTNIPNYGRIRYTGIYPGIDLVYYGNQRRLEHDFIVAPHANPSQITLSFQGSGKLAVDVSTGDLLIKTSQDEVRLLRPVTWQLSAGKRTEIPTSYKLLTGNRVRFSIARYDHSVPLIIDPIITFSTLLTSYNLSVAGLAVDASGNSYLTGSTAYLLPATPGAYQTIDKATYAGFGGSTPFVAKFNATGTALIYATYLGGSLNDSAQAITIDAAGNAYVTGYATSTDFPVTTGALQTVNKGSQNAFVTKLNAAGSALIYSTYLGGSGGGGDQYSYINGDIGNAIAIDTAGNAYITGSTQSTNFPVTTGAYQAGFKGSAQNPVTPNAFIAKLNPTGTGLVYATYLGGTGVPGYFYRKGGDYANAIALDGSGNAYVAGLTYSDDFPVTSGAFQTQQKAAATPLPNSNGFVSKLSADGKSLVYSTYLGGYTAPAVPALAGDTVNAIALDPSGNAFITGHVTSSNFPTTGNAYQVSGGDGHPAFVAKLNSAGTALIYSTLLGGVKSGGEQDSGNAIAIDSAGDAYITGSDTTGANSSSFPVSPSAFESQYLTSSPAFVAEFDPEGANLLYATFLNTLYTNVGVGIAVKDAGNVYVAGSGGEIGFPLTAGAYETISPLGNGGGFLTKLDFTAALGREDTRTTLTSQMADPVQGVPATLTARVARIVSGAVPTGSVDFRVNGLVVATAPLNGSGVATYTAGYLPAFADTISADYNGSTALNPSSIILATSIGLLTVSPVSGGNQTTTYGSNFAQPLVVTATDPSGRPVPGDKILFASSGLTPSASAVVTDANGQAQVAVFASSAGRFTVSALENGSNNYNFPANFTLTSRKVILRLQPPSYAAHYGQPIPPLTRYDLTGFVNGDTQASATTGAPVLSTAATSTSPVGVYPVNISIGTLASANYAFNPVAGLVQVYKAQLTIHPDSFLIHVGDPLPAFTYKLTGFVNGDTQASATTGAPVFTTNAPSLTKPGRYYIIGNVGTLSAHNYSFAAPTPATNGILTIVR